MKVPNTVIGNASPDKVLMAKQLRRTMTPAEKVLWKHLRTNKLAGFHFRRQQVIEGYIADFYCHETGLVIEVDGGIHKTQKEYDAARDAVLTKKGFVVSRVINEDVVYDIEKVLAKILQRLSMMVI
jgi:very-short-patch-repair endonuclease